MDHDKHSRFKNKDYPTTVEGITKFYDEWAPTIDEESVRNGYIGPVVIAEALAKVLSNKDGVIMDMACGTGRVAQELKRLGFENIDGVDISKESLKVSEEKGIYKRLICDSIGTNKLDVKDDSYDGLVCSGALALGHLNQECFPEWIRIVKPGGYIIFNVGSISLNTFEKFKDGKFDTDLQELTGKGLWEMTSHETAADYHLDEPGQMYIFKVLK